MLLYFVMWLLHGVSFFHSTKFYKTGEPTKFHRYAWAYFVFHAASLMIMVTIAYAMYIPWGKGNIFDFGAELFHSWIDGRANVPFLGYSWLYMILDVQFQLFVCFSMYSLFIVIISQNFMAALTDWKKIGDGQSDPSQKKKNEEIFQYYDAIFKKRIGVLHPEYRQAMHQLKLRLEGVEGLDADNLPGFVDFRLHLYLTDGLGKAIQYLVQVSLTTNIFLACSALLVAFLAHHYQVVFMYFLPGFLVVGLVVFVLGYLLALHFRKLADVDDHKTPAKYITVHSYCRCVQIVLYCIFFSFSRLLLSNDIFEFYPRVYFTAVIGLLVLFTLLVLFAGEMTKEISCSLILPPHLHEKSFREKLAEIKTWHTTDRCHECGTGQATVMSASKQWASLPGQGQTPRGKLESEPDTSRPGSFR